MGFGAVKGDAMRDGGGLLRLGKRRGFLGLAAQLEAELASGAIGAGWDEHLFLSIGEHALEGIDTSHFGEQLGVVDVIGELFAEVGGFGRDGLDEPIAAGDSFG